jgi:hypothetical protein
MSERGTLKIWALSTWDRFPKKPGVEPLIPEIKLKKDLILSFKPPD